MITRNSIVIFTSVFAFFFILNFLSPPQGDDWNWIVGNHDINHAINSFFTWNSRIGEFVYIAFLSRIPLLLFDAINALVASIFVFLLFYLIFSKIPNDISSAILVCVCVAFMMVLLAFEEAFLWASGALNYLWGYTISLFVLLFYKMYLQTKRQCSTYIFTPIFFITSIIAGAWHEGTSIITFVILIGLLIYAKYYKTTIPLWFYAGIVGIGIGCLFLILSPGQQNRAMMESNMREYISIGKFLGMDFIAKIMRIYHTLNNACQRNPIFFPIFAFMVIYLKAFFNITNNIIAKIAICCVALVMFYMIFIALPLVAYLLLLGGFYYVYFKTNDRIFIISFWLLCLWFIAQLSTFQLTDIPFRAKAFSTIALIAIMLLFISTMKTKITYIFMAFSVAYAVYALYQYGNLYIKWNNLVNLVESKKLEYDNSGKQLVQIRREIMYGGVNMITTSKGYDIDLVIPTKDFSFDFRGFTPWWRLSQDTNDETNKQYAKIFNIKSIRLE